MPKNFQHFFLKPAFCLTVIFCFAVLDISYGKSIDNKIKNQKSRLSEIKKQLENERVKLKKLHLKKASVLDQVKELKHNIDVNENYVQELNHTQKLIESSIRENKTEVDNLSTKISKRNQVMGYRVRSLFVKGKGKSLVDEFVNPGDYKSLLKRIFFLNRIIQYDKQLVRQSKTDRQFKKNKLTELDTRIQQVQDFQKFKKNEIQGLNNNRKKLKKDIEKIQTSTELKKRALAELETNSKAIHKIIKLLEKRRQKEIAQKNEKEKIIFSRKDKFCKPIQGKLVSKYGKQYHSTLKTMTKNLGVEYMGKAGTFVKAAASGEVVYVDDIPGYGKGVIIYNGSGYYNIYGNLKNIKVRVGDVLKGCREIAVIPSSKVKKNRQIYFEVRKNRNSLDPVKWLKKMIN